ncbi:MAG: hypothetical protein ACI86H_002376 [bacterium]|jgi:hypothetical protein
MTFQLLNLFKKKKPSSKKILEQLSQALKLLVEELYKDESSSWVHSFHQCYRQSCYFLGEGFTQEDLKMLAERVQSHFVGGMGSFISRCNSICS